jgi:hypothetical protein
MSTPKATALAQRASSRMLAGACRAAIEAFREIVVSDCDRALAKIDRLERWLASNKKRPAWLDDYYWAAGIRYETIPEPEGYNKEMSAEAEALFKREYEGRFDLLEIAVVAAMNHASGLDAEPIDVAMKRLREVAMPGRWWEDATIETDITRAIDAALGAGPRYAQESEARS